MADTKKHLTRGMIVLVVSMATVVTLYSCSTSKPLIAKSLLAGHWLTTQSETRANIILDSNNKYLLLLEDTTSSDTLHFTYQLKGKVMTIFYSPTMWISKNVIIKLSSDSFVYKRKGDGALFRYWRNKLTGLAETNHK